MRRIRPRRNSRSSQRESKSFLRHWEIYQSDAQTKGRNRIRVTPKLIVLMSLRPVIPGGLLSSIARFRFTSRTQCATVADRLQVQACLLHVNSGLRRGFGAESSSHNQARFIT